MWIHIDCHSVLLKQYGDCIYIYILQVGKCLLLMPFDQLTDLIAVSYLLCRLNWRFRAYLRFDVLIDMFQERLVENMMLSNTVFVILLSEDNAFQGCCPSWHQPS